MSRARTRETSGATEAAMRERISSVASPIVDFLRTEGAGAAALLVATAGAMVWANAAPNAYEATWRAPLFGWHGPLPSGLDLRHWVNEGLMAVFFFVVGLEIRREMTDGELSDPRRAALPAVGALGGMVAPALFYLAFNREGDAVRGWGVPVATDIAFSVGLLALFGKRVGLGLKVFLLSLAIVDDIGAIAVIAIIYSVDLRVDALALAGILSAAFAAGWRLPLSRWWLLPIAVAAWYATLLSGVHATLAGVALGLLVPTPRAGSPVPAGRLEHALHPWTSLGVVPLFALANAGLAIAPDSITSALGSSVGLGVIAGLVLGKPFGISLAVFVATRAGLRLPHGMSFGHVVALGATAGIGFTVSLFIADAAFGDPAVIAVAKLAVLCASIVSALAGAILLALTTRPK